MKNTNQVPIKHTTEQLQYMITRSLLIIAIVGATAISLLTAFTSSAYSIRTQHRDPNLSPFLPIPFSPPCTPTSMLLDSVSVLSMEYDCSVPNTSHPNVALSSQHNLMASRQISPQLNNFPRIR